MPQILKQMQNRKASRRQYLISSVAVCLVAIGSYPFADLIGYRSVALILLFTISILAMRLSLYPVLLAALLSALIWNFFFIPPHFTLHISETEDVLMLIMYFIIALLNGVLTARMKRFEELARQKEERATTLKLYDTLFNSLSHELRTPIATIMGASDNLLAENTRMTEGVKKNLYQQINQASERLHLLVENLLNMSRLESGFIQPKLDWCDVPDLIYTVVNRLEDKAKNHRIQVDIAENMPLVKVDFGLMEQVLSNIINNALNYTPEGSSIFVKSYMIDNQFVIEILDSGKGLSMEEVTQIFEKFYSIKGSKTGGLGLGLSIAKGFVEVHKGTIKAENDVNGAKFILKIPTEISVLNTLNDE